MALLWPRFVGAAGVLIGLLMSSAIVMLRHGITPRTFWIALVFGLGGAGVIAMSVPLLLVKRDR